MLMKQIFFLLIASICLISCAHDEVAHNGKIKIVTTTQMIKDVVENIGGDKVEVISLMGPGVDPHLYKATQGDLEKLSNADIIFYNGLHLEGKMQNVFERMSKTKSVVAVAQDIKEDDLILLAQKGDEVVHDPHIWHSVGLWSNVIFPIKNTLIEFDKDSTNRIGYEVMAKMYWNDLKYLDDETRATIAKIPKEQRLLITSHDAFNYYGRDYDIEVKGLQGISTVAEVGIKDVTEMVDLLVKRKVKAVFVESSVPKKPLEAVIQGCKQKGHAITIGGTLYSDAMGNNDTEEGTYIGMIKYNTNTIYKALN